MYLDAEEAARALGVSLSTLYAYVSRKKIRSQALPGTKKRRYWKDDILSLQGEPAVETGGVLAPTTDITLINETGPFYRGRSALRLSETATIEDVAGLLWNVDPVAAFATRPAAPTKTYIRIKHALAGATLTEQVVTLLPVLERGNPRAYDLSRAGYACTAAAIMRWLAAMIVDAPAPIDQPLHSFLGEGLGKPDIYHGLIRRMLVLAADHELDPTTYAVRAVANTGATAYQIAATGIASSMGRRLIFGRAQSLNRLLDELAQSGDPAEPIIRRLREGEAIPGFTTSIYKSGDPRATSLLAAISDSLDIDHDMSRLTAAIRVVSEATGQSPDFALPVMYLNRKLGLASEGLLFRLGRLVGWIAHAMEQYHSHPLVRPRALYTGTLPATDKSPNVDESNQA